MEKTAFKHLITLQNWKAKMVKAELEKQGIPVKIMSQGTGVSWDEILGGGVSPEIFMPAFPLDIYVPENRMERSKETLVKLNITGDEREIPKTKLWQKICAAVVLLIFVLTALVTLIHLFTDMF